MLINLQFEDFFHCHSVAGFYFDSVVIREHTLYDSKCFNFAEVCLMAKNMVYLGGFHRHWKKSMHSPFVGYNVVRMLTVMIVLFSSFISLPIFWLVVPPGIESEVLKAPTITVDLSISPLCSISFRFLHLRHTHLGVLHFSGGLIFNSLVYLRNFLSLKVHFLLC